MHNHGGQSADDKHQTNANQDLGHLPLFHRRLPLAPLTARRHLLPVPAALAQSEKDSGRTVGDDGHGDVAEQHGQDQVIVQHHRVQVLHREGTELDKLDSGVVPRAVGLPYIEQGEDMEAECEGQDEEHEACCGDSASGEQRRGVQRMEDGDVALHGDEAGEEAGHRAQSGGHHDGPRLVFHLETRHTLTYTDTLTLTHTDSDTH